MLVGLTLFSIIWVRVLRLILGNNASPDSAVPDVLSIAITASRGMELYTAHSPEPLAALALGSLSAPSWESWASSSAIRSRVGSLCCPCFTGSGTG